VCASLQAARLYKPGAIGQQNETAENSLLLFFFSTSLSIHSRVLLFFFFFRPSISYRSKTKQK
jgi:hypothetical protein